MISGRSLWSRLFSSRQLVPLAIILVTLLAAVYVASYPSPMYLMLLVGLIAAIILLRQPELGLVAFIVGALVVPFGLSTGTESDLNFAVLGAGGFTGIWLVEMLRKRELHLASSRPIAPLLIFTVLTGLAFLLGNQPLFVFAQTAPLRAQLGGLMVFVLSAGIYLVVGHQIRDLRWLELIVWLFVFLGSVYVAGQFVPAIGNLVGPLFRQRSSLGAVGSLFWVWLMAMSLSQGLFNHRLQTAWRAALLGVALATFAAGYAQRGWSSGYIPVVAAAGALVWLRSWRLGVVAVVVGGIYLFALNPVFFTSILTGENYSISTRLVAWQILLGQIIEASPLLGLGPANYYWYTPLFSILGYYVSFNSHNQYIDIVMQTGLLGLLAFLWFVVAVAWLSWELRHRVSEGFARAYVYGALGGLAGTLVAGMLGDWFLPFVYNIGLSGFRASVLGWFFLGGLIAVERLAVNPRSAGVPGQATHFPQQVVAHIPS